MGLMRRGSNQKYADHYLDYDQGFDLTLPHLGQSRALARLMQADAYVHMHDGNTAAAVDRIASLYRMGGHAGDDRILISSLVGQAIWNTGDRVLQSALDRGVLTAGEAATVLSAASDLASNDPFSYVEAVVMEQEIAVQTHLGEGRMGG